VYNVIYIKDTKYKM